VDIKIIKTQRPTRSATTTAAGWRAFHTVPLLLPTPIERRMQVACTPLSSLSLVGGIMSTHSGRLTPRIIKSKLPTHFPTPSAWRPSRKWSIGRRPPRCSATEVLAFGPRECSRPLGSSRICCVVPRVVLGVCAAARLASFLRSQSNLLAWNVISAPGYSPRLVLGRRGPEKLR
jgi:hypothetical protein